MERYFLRAKRTLDDIVASLPNAIQDIIDFFKQELSLESILNKFKNIKEKASDFQTNVSCLQTRLRHHAKQSQRRKHYVKRAIDSMDDCFDFMSEPLYGFRTNITFQQKCLDKECSVNLETHIFQNRQTGEDFTSDGPPECRPISVC